MNLKIGVKIAFNNAEGLTYRMAITEMEKLYSFGFEEVVGLVNISLKEEGGRIIFTRTFNDD